MELPLTPSVASWVLNISTDAYSGTFINPELFPLSLQQPQAIFFTNPSAPQVYLVHHWHLLFSSLNPSGRLSANYFTRWTVLSAQSSSRSHVKYGFQNPGCIFIDLSVANWPKETQYVDSVNLSSLSSSLIYGPPRIRAWPWRKFPWQSNGVFSPERQTKHLISHYLKPVKHL